MPVISIRRTRLFDDWLSDLRDPLAQARIAKRIDRVAFGNPGQWRSVGDGVLELKIDYGPDYRVYYVYAGGGEVAVLLLCGGDKSTQDRDIRIAKQLAAKIGREEAAHEDGKIFIRLSGLSHLR